MQHVFEIEAFMAQQWVPPENPDPKEIRDEAEVIAERALQLLEDETHGVQFSDALEGIPPERLR